MEFRYSRLIQKSFFAIIDYLITKLCTRNEYPDSSGERHTSSFWGTPFPELGHILELMHTQPIEPPA